MLGRQINFKKGNPLNKFKLLAAFTLIELMVVVIIVAILAGIAYPSYEEYIIKSRRSDAKSALLSLQQAQEKYRTNCPQYATGIAAAYSCNAGGSHNLVSSATSPDGYYILDILDVPGAEANKYVIRAVPTGDQVGDSACPRFTINQNGQHAGVDGDIATNADNDPGVTINTPLGTCW